MPYSSKSRYTHHRRVNPDELKDMKTVPISHVPHRKKYPKGTKAVVGKDKRTGKRRTQTVLIPKQNKHR